VNDENVKTAQIEDDFVSIAIVSQRTVHGPGRFPRRAGRAAAAVILVTPPPPPNHSCRRAAAAAADNNAA